MSEPWQQVTDALPLLIPISPLIGVATTAIMSRQYPVLVRPMALSNAMMTLLLVVAAFFLLPPMVADEQGRPVSRETMTGLLWLGEIVAPAGADERPSARGMLLQIAFHADGLSLWPALLLSISVLSVLSLPEESYASRFATHCFGLQISQALLLASFFSADAIVCILFLELALAPICGLIGKYGFADRRTSASNWWVWQFIGCGCSLLGVTLLAVSRPWMQLDLVSVRGPILFDTAFLADSLRQLLHRSETALQVWSHVAPWAALLVLAGLVIRLPVFPCLGWFHSAATSAPIGISILMTTVIPLAAVSEWLRLGMPLFGLDQGMVSGTLGLLSLAGLWQNVLVLRSETDVKRMLIAISSAMLCVSGIALSFQQFDAIRGAWLLVVSQGLAIGGGLLIAQYLQARAGTCDLRRIGDQMAQSRQLSEMLTLVLLFWAGVPLIGVAAALTLIFSAVPADSVWLAIAMSVGLVLVAIASLSAITRLATVVGHDKAAVTGIGPEAHGLDLTASEWLAVIPFFGLLVFVNVSPELFLKPCRPGFLRAAQVSKQAATTQNAIRSSGSPRQSLPLTARTVAGTARP